MNALLDLVARQLADDLRGAPAAARAHFSAEGRARRCHTIDDLRALARRTVARPVFDYVDGAAGDEVTSRRNRAAFARVELRPRTLVDVSDVTLATTVLGRAVALPILAAPTGLTGLTHPDGEVAVARAAHAAGSLSTVSTLSSCSLEEVHAAAPGRKWFQLYVLRDRGLTAALVDRAEAAGYEALMLTVDVQVAGVRDRDVRNRFSVPPRLTLRTLADGARHPRWTAAFAARPRITPGNFGLGGGAASLAAHVNRQFDPTLTWEDVARLRERWRGPLLIKGIMRADDAVRAAEHGVDAVVVSNHGGRQLDHAQATIDALPAIADAVGDRVELYLDSGVRRGTDVVKALALGARAVLVGRPLMYGLGAAGEAGVRRAFAILRAELATALALAGCPGLEDLGPGAVTGPDPM
ncbi:MAG TPA: alpha-hydroxy acid oxidase [Solirubrobacter sp.]|nr:alpha-hydroxy acid oxidase [Solirubrobacter sp.]